MIITLETIYGWSQQFEKGIISTANKEQYEKFLQVLRKVHGFRDKIFDANLPSTLGGCTITHSKHPKHCEVKIDFPIDGESVTFAMNEGGMLVMTDCYLVMLDLDAVLKKMTEFESVLG